MHNKVVMIAGMHRSGTSVAAQWLHRCGLFLGDKLLGPGTGNEDGHFEDEEFLQLHQSLLQQLQLPDTGLTGTALSSLPAAENQKIKAVLDAKNSRHTQWGWKEPRTCLFLHEYGLLLPSALYVVVVRNYNDTVNSLVTREYKMQEEKISRKKGLSKLKWKLFKRKSMEQLLKKQSDDFLRVWINYYERIFEHLSTVPPERVAIVTSKILAENDRPVFLKLTADWGLQLNYCSFKEVFKKQHLSETHLIARFVKNKNLLMHAEAIEYLLAIKYGVLV